MLRAASGTIKRSYISDQFPRRIVYEDVEATHHPHSLYQCGCRWVEQFLSIALNFFAVCSGKVVRSNLFSFVNTFKLCKLLKMFDVNIRAKVAIRGNEEYDSVFQMHKYISCVLCQANTAEKLEKRESLNLRNNKPYTLKGRS